MGNVKPTIVLTIVSTIIAALVIVASKYWPEPTGLTDNLREKCIALGGEAEYILIDGWEEAGYNKNVKNVITNENDDIIIQVAAKGYAKDGINVLVAMNVDGSVKAVELVELKETPGFGEKVTTPEFIEKFIGLEKKASLVKSAPKDDGEIQSVTGATRSSEGMVDAINIAIETYNRMGVKR